MNAPQRNFLGNRLRRLGAAAMVLAVVWLIIGLGGLLSLELSIARVLPLAYGGLILHIIGEFISLGNIE